MGELDLPELSFAPTSASPSSCHCRVINSHPKLPVKFIRGTNSHPKLPVNFIRGTDSHPKLPVKFIRGRVLTAGQQSPLCLTGIQFCSLCSRSCCSKAQSSGSDLVLNSGPGSVSGGCIWLQGTIFPGDVQGHSERRRQQSPIPAQPGAEQGRSTSPDLPLQHSPQE